MPSTKKPTPLDAAGRAEARQKLAELVKVAHTFPAEALRDQEAVDLAQQLLVSGDPADQDFILEQVRAAPSGQVGGRLALLLVGVADPYRMTRPDPEKAARPEILRGLEPLLSTPEPWNYLWRAATTAFFLTDPLHAAERLRAFLTPPTDADRRARDRLQTIVHTALSLEAEPSRATLELGLRAAELREFRGYDEVVSSVVGPLGRPGHEAELAHILELDLLPELIERVFRLLVCNSSMRLVQKERKRILPAVEAVAAGLRDDPAGRARLEAVDKALELGGGLLSPKPLKVPKAPKPPARIKLKFAAGSDGGPLLALPKEALDAWYGTVDPKTGKPPPSSDSGDFTGTDYGRACDISSGPLQSPWGGFGFLDVGGHTGLVLGRSVSTASLKDGSVLLVVQADEEGEDVAAFLKADPKWQDLDGKLTLPSGALVVFDSAREHARGKNKSPLELPPGTYRVQEHHSETKTTSLWLFRLSLAGG